MQQKSNFINETLSAATKLGQIASDVEELKSIYQDRGYGAGGADEITQADLDEVPVVVQLADFTDMVTCMQQLLKFMGNEAVTQGDYESTINKVRVDK